MKKVELSIETVAFTMACTMGFYLGIERKITKEEFYEEFFDHVVDGDEAILVTDEIIEASLEYYNEYIVVEDLQPTNTPNIDLALKQLEPWLQDEVQWVQDLCRELVEEAAAPNVWDDIVCEKLIERKADLRSRTKRMCEISFYQSIAEQAYDGIDIDKLIEEAQNSK
jgi:hypothetical protein